MTVKELIDKLQQFDEDKLVLVEDEYKEFQAIDVEPVNDRSKVIELVIYVIRKVGSNRAGFIKFDD